MNILLPIASQQKGFLISLGKMLAHMGHRVFFAPSDKDVADLIRRLAPELAGDMLVSDSKPPSKDLMSRALQLESTYKTPLSMLLSYDRALGRGYLFNIDRYPNITRSDWSHERKIGAFVSRFDQAELYLDACRPDLIIGLQKSEVLTVVAKERDVVYLSLAPVKIGNRFLWSDDPYLTSHDFLASLRRNIGKEMAQLPPVEEYTQEAGSKFNHKRIQYNYRRSLNDAMKIVINESKSLLSGRRKKDSYRPFGWVPTVFRRTHNYNYLRRCGVFPEQISERKAVYVPLHLEPEIALLSISPEFNNSMEMIAWISKSLPADGMVVVKEQPFSFGVRSRRYYRQLMQIGNVVLANPITTSWDWIKSAAVTATITGTAGTEAVMFGRPVLSFGRHQAINLLPTVRFARDYDSTRRGIVELIEICRNDPIFELSRRSLYAAQIENSFPLPGFERTYKSEQLEDELASKAIDGLKLILPEVAATQKQ